MTVENISRSISTKECCRPWWGLNSWPPGLQSDGASNWATEAGGKALCNKVSYMCMSGAEFHLQQDSNQRTYDAVLWQHKLKRFIQPMPCWINYDATPSSNCQPITFLDPDCCYTFTDWMANSADPDHLASSEANWSGSTLFAKAGYMQIQLASLGLRKNITFCSSLTRKHIGSCAVSEYRRGSHNFAHTVKPV